MVRRKQKRKAHWNTFLASVLSGALAVTTCVTVPVTSQAAGTGNTELQNPRVVMNYCDTVYFGSYWQEDTNGDGKVDQTDEKQKIRWRILWQNEDGTDAYVMADKVLDCKKYNEEYTDVTWETSPLREWLNNDFYNTAFSLAEKDAIIEQTLKNEDNEKYGTVGGNDTTDKVYLSSLSDMKNLAYGFSDDYFFQDQARIGKATSYAKAQGVNTNGEMGSWWWLRSPGDRTLHASFVSDHGYVGTDGAIVDHNFGGVRPALHLNLSSSLVQKGERLPVFLKSAEWDVVELGTWDESPISWRVLSVNGNDVFLLSDQILTYKEYNVEDKSITWADSTLRTWLNGNFYSSAFTDAEQKGIVETTYENADNPWYGTEGGNDTKDKVTLLSLTDIVNVDYGFSTDYYCGHPSRIACSESGYGENGWGSSWWLRSPGYRTDHASGVSDYGIVYPFGNIVYNYHEGVRPALHFNLSSFPLTKKGTVTAEAGVKLVNSDEQGGSDIPGGSDTSGNTNTPISSDDEKDTGNTTEKSNGGQSSTTEQSNGQATTTEKQNGDEKQTTEKPSVTTETKTAKKDNSTTINIKNKKTYKKSQKVTIKDKDGIKQIKLNSKTIKVKNKKSYSFKLSKYKKHLKKKGKWNKLVVTDKKGKKKTIQFKTK